MYNERVMELSFYGELEKIAEFKKKANFLIQSAKAIRRPLYSTARAEKGLTSVMKNVGRLSDDAASAPLEHQNLGKFLGGSSDDFGKVMGLGDDVLKHGDDLAIGIGGRAVKPGEMRSAFQAAKGKNADLTPQQFLKDTYNFGPGQQAAAGKWADKRIIDPSKYDDMSFGDWAREGGSQLLGWAGRNPVKATAAGVGLYALS
tara:strand:+ start:4919 stop:5524 length:606 start_codon:yes stop_codon:yes gene_type:complete